MVFKIRAGVLCPLHEVVYLCQNYRIMPIPVNIEQLLSATAIEGSRIEYKEGWNPNAIYRTICAFANDFDNSGGGYIVVGVQEKNGRPVRPVKGLELDEIEPIEKEMIGFNNLMQPTYYPHTSIEDADGKKVLVIWVPGGANRPYKVPEEVTAKQKRYNYYVRYNSSSIIARGEFERELLELSNQIPFDDRANMQATLKDISKTLVRDFLVKTGSRLADSIEESRFSDILQQMDIVTGPAEALVPKNIALMMFSDTPSRFFPYSQVDIVVYPKGKLQDPSNFMEVPPIKGPVDWMINEVMTYLRTNVIKERVVKQENKAEAIRFFNYPYQALEEAVVNSLYHRDYQMREPVEITVEPDCIRIISYGGPDRSIKLDELNRGLAHARRYRNRKLGDFLKELDLTEGKATGIPTIIKEMTANGSPSASFETDDARTYFIATFPVHPAFAQNDAQNDAQNPIVVTLRQNALLELVRANENITRMEMSKLLKISKPTIERDIKYLKEQGVLNYEGSSKSGKWVIDPTFSIAVK